MAGNTKSGGRSWSGWRIAAWSAAAFLLLLPLAAMQITDEVAWDAADFAFAAALLLGVGFTYELAAKMTANAAYRAAVGVALGAAFLLVWINAAVGIIGSEDNPANLMYGGVLLVGIAGAIIARFRPRGMVWAMAATALAQVLVGAIAIVAGLGMPASPPLELIGLTALFTGLWLASAWLFRIAARNEPRAA